MDYYAKMSTWAKLLGLIENRVKVANQILEADCYDQPVKTGYEHCVYYLEIEGYRMAEWELYDIDGAQKALDMVDFFKQGLWMLFRSRVIDLC